MSKRIGLPKNCPQCNEEVEHDLDKDTHCQNSLCDFDFRDIWDFVKNRPHSTHKLKCSHSYNSKSRVDYYMDCIILKKMPNNRLKIKVFGDRRNKDSKVQKTRYIHSYRVSNK